MHRQPSLPQQHSHADRLGGSGASSACTATLKRDGYRLVLQCEGGVRRCSSFRCGRRISLGTVTSGPSIAAGPDPGGSGRGGPGAGDAGRRPGPGAPAGDQHGSGEAGARQPERRPRGHGQLPPHGKHDGDKLKIKPGRPDDPLSSGQVRALRSRTRFRSSAIDSGAQSVISLRVLSNWRRSPGSEVTTG